MKLEIINISEKLNSQTILNNFNLELKQGEIVSIIGPNGAGKTTLFNIITGITYPTHGKIKIDGQDITKYPLYIKAKLGIGYLPQNISIFEKLTVKENLQIALEAKFKRDKKIIKEKMENILNIFDLQNIKNVRCSNISGGEKHKVEFARIIAIEPKFLLLDEPFAGIDPITIDEIKSIIVKLKNDNIGIIITDHNIRETLSIVDRAYVVYNGNTICSGSVNEILTNEDVKKIYLGRDFYF